MVEIKDIVDRESLEAWLRGKPIVVSIQVSTRAALRFLPHYLEYLLSSEEREGVSPIPVLLPNLIAEVAARSKVKILPEQIKNLATRADSFATKKLGIDPAARYAYGFALVNEKSAALDASEAATAIEAWGEIRNDCANFALGKDLTYLPLLEKTDKLAADKWKTSKQILSRDVAIWSFWIKWYESILAGVPLSYGLLERIALIPSEDWEKGSEHVNAIIAAIETEFELKAKIVELEAKLLQISSSGRGIGDNQGPPMADEPVAKEIMIIWEPLQELKQEIEEEHPNRERLLAIAKKIGELSAAIFKWAAGLANFALKTYIGVAAAKLATVADPVATILSAIYDLVLKLVGYLP